MLNKEAAEKQTSQFQFHEDGEKVDELRREDSRFGTKIRRLPPAIRRIGVDLWNLDKKPAKRFQVGASFVYPMRDPTDERLTKFDKLRSGDRQKILAIPFPKMAEEVEQAWDYLQAFPYQDDMDTRKAFRSPKNGEESLGMRGSWLDSMFSIAEKYKEELLEPVFLAKWAPYLKGSYWNWEKEIGMLLASVISQGGKMGREVFGVLHDSLLGRHDIGAMGRHVVHAFLMSSNEEGWELIEKTLIAAQRQEGLRQSIVETVDLAHPDAFLRMLKLIREHEWTRFSSVVRAVDVWFGLGWDSASTKVVNGVIERAIQFLEAPAAIKSAIAGNDAEKADMALWVMAYEDSSKSVKPAAGLLKHKSPEMRFVAVRHLERLATVEATNLRWTASDDADLRVAARAIGHVGHEAPRDAFERIKRFVGRLEAKETELKPIVWPWTGTKLDREQIAGQLCDAIGDRNPIVLIPHLERMSTYGRQEVVQLFGMQKNLDAEGRKAVLQLALDSSATVRSAAFEAIANLKLTAEERQGFCEGLSRKTADLRLGILGALERGEDAACLKTVDSLLTAKDANKRLGGLEFLRRLTDQGRLVDECKSRAERFAESQKCSKAEKAHLDAIRASGKKESRLTLENALGFMDPAKRTPVVAPKKIKLELITPKVKAYLEALDALVHEHRETPVKNKFSRGTSPTLLGEMGWSFPGAYWRRSLHAEVKNLPLAETWLAWHDERGDELRDKKGCEPLRAWLWAEMQSELEYGLSGWVKKNALRKPFVAPLLELKFPKLRYEQIVSKLLTWLYILRPSDHQIEYLLDTAEMFAALVPPESLQLAKPASKDGKKKTAGYDWNAEEKTPWRGESGPICVCLNLLSGLEEQLTVEQFKRYWQLTRWIDEPIEGAERERPKDNVLLSAYFRGVANLNDVADSLLGTRHVSQWGYRNPFTLLEGLTERKLTGINQKALESSPELRSLVSGAVNRIVDAELVRGESPTAASAPAQNISSILGLSRMLQFLTAIGGDGFKFAAGWRSEKAEQRLNTLTRLARVTFPKEEDTAEEFTKRMKEEIAKKSFPEDRLIELAFLAPQWSKHVQHYFGWEGMAEALYWYLAHMNFMWSSNAVENAAESAGFVEQTPAPAAEGAPDTGDDSDEQVEAPKVEVLSPWEQLVRERTALTKTERDDGAIDVDWFHRVYKEIGPKNWERIAKAAKFAANAAQAKKASLIASVLLGEADLKELITGIEKRFLKDNVRLIGLFPLPKGDKREAELSKRHKVLVEYGRYAKQLSGLTKPAALRALEIGLKNLASTAGFEDALRLDWALGASEWADLAKGPVKASKEGTEVTLAIDEQVMPVITVTKNGQELKAAPAAVKKEPKVAVLFERAKELRRQSSRQKQALEAAMLRGDEFSSTELVQLCEHALVAPFLTRLVLVGDGVMGYPDKGGRALRDFDGKLEPVKKGERLRIAHSHDLFASKRWDNWQRDCFAAERIQPFKQVFRELYVATSQEKADGYKSNRYAGQQVQPRQAGALFGSRGWNTGEGVFKVFHREGIVAWVSTNSGVTTPLEVEGWTMESVHFAKRGEWKPMSMKDVPPRIFSEVMRDVDLVVSVAHRGGVDPEASASTVEMRASLLRETSKLLGLNNIRIKEQYALIDGFHANYSLHLGSGSIHRLPGGYLCVVPVHSQHRGRLFLPFADDDPRTAEVISKSLLLARDKEISDPSILEQLRA
jgi:hypothetical protein